VVAQQGRGIVAYLGVECGQLGAEDLAQPGRDEIPPQATRMLADRGA